MKIIKEVELTNGKHTTYGETKEEIAISIAKGFSKGFFGVVGGTLLGFTSIVIGSEIHYRINK